MEPSRQSSGWAQRARRPPPHGRAPPAAPPLHRSLRRSTVSVVRPARSPGPAEPLAGGRPSRGGTGVLGSTASPGPRLRRPAACFADPQMSIVLGAGRTRSVVNPTSSAAFLTVIKANETHEIIELQGERRARRAHAHMSSTCGGLANLGRVRGRLVDRAQLVLGRDAQLFMIASPFTRGLPSSARRRSRLDPGVVSTMIRAVGAAPCPCVRMPRLGHGQLGLCSSLPTRACRRCARASRGR